MTTRSGQHGQAAVELVAVLPLLAALLAACGRRRCSVTRPGPRPRRRERPHGPTPWAPTREPPPARTSLPGSSAASASVRPRRRGDGDRAGAVGRGDGPARGLVDVGVRGAAVTGGLFGARRVRSAGEGGPFARVRSAAASRRSRSWRCSRSCSRRAWRGLALERGAAEEVAGNAAEAGAVALLQGREPRAAARAALAGWPRERAEVRLAGRRVTVRVTPRGPFGARRARAQRRDAGPAR